MVYDMTTGERSPRVPGDVASLASAATNGAAAAATAGASSSAAAAASSQALVAQGSGSQQQAERGRDKRDVARSNMEMVNLKLAMQTRDVLATKLEEASGISVQRHRFITQADLVSSLLCLPLPSLAPSRPRPANSLPLCLTYSPTLLTLPPSLPSVPFLPDCTHPSPLPPIWFATLRCR